MYERKDRYAVYRFDYGIYRDCQPELFDPEEEPAYIKETAKYLEEHYESIEPGGRIGQGKSEYEIQDHTYGRGYCLDRKEV